MALKKKGDFFNVALALIIFLLLILILKEPAETVRKKINNLVMPAKSRIYKLTTSTKSNVGNVFYVDDLVKNQKILEQEIYRLKVENLNLKGIDSENRRLREILELKQREQMNFTVAKISFRDPQNIYSMLYIDKGAKDGIEKDMVVLNKNMLLGRVTEVEQDSSKVELITKKGINTSVITEDGNNLAILRGEGNNILTLEYLIAEVKIKKGDILVTSGMSGIYPKNIMVGKITDAKDEGDNLFKTQEIRAPYSILSIEEVVILKK
jgi:rod shape-determining protein MreC